MQKNQILLLTLLTATITVACTTAPITSTNYSDRQYKARESIGFYQTEISIKNQERRANDPYLNSRIKRINWDEWQ